MANEYSAGGAGGALPMDALDATAFGASSPGLPLPDDSRFAPEPYRMRAPAGVAPMVPSASDPFGLGLSGGLPTPSAPLVLDLPPAPMAAPAATPAPARPAAPAAHMAARAVRAAQARETAPALPADLVPDVTGYAGPEYDARLAQGAALYQETGGQQGIAPSTFQAAQQARQQYRMRNPDVAFVEDVQRGRAQTEATVGGIAVQQELAQAELAQREADIEKQRQKFAYEEFEAAKARAKEQQDALRFAETEMDTLNQEVRETKIDPNAYWTNQNAFGKALSAISVALGAFAQGMSGGRVPNTALQLMNAAIEREIDAQKANLANKRASLADKRSIYAMARQRFGDAEQAENYTRARLQEALGATVSQYRGEARTEQLRLGGEKLTAEIGQKVREYDNATRDAYVKRDMERREEERRRRAAAEAYAAGAEERRLKRAKTLGELEEQQARIGKMRAETAGIGADKVGVVTVVEPTATGERAPVQYAVSKDYAKPASEAALSASNFRSAIDAALSASKESGYRIEGSEAARKFDAAMGQARGSLAKALASGYNPTAAHEAQAAALLPAKPWLQTGAWENALRSQIGLVDRQVQNALQTFGAQPIGGAAPTPAPVKTYSTPR